MMQKNGWLNNLKRNSMQKEFVEYELALKLKELGFDEPCFSTYNSDKKVSRNPSHNMEDLPIEGQPYYWQNSKIHVSCITAPTFSQAFRWFREKYSLIGSIDYSNRLKWYYVLREFITSDIFPNLNTSSKGEFESYEEAELACLDKLLEIVESKKSKMTAIEWLLNEMFNNNGLKKEQGVMYISPNLIKQAKEMEKQQIIEASRDGQEEQALNNGVEWIKYAEQYYNETFKSE